MTTSQGDNVEGGSGGGFLEQIMAWWWNPFRSTPAEATKSKTPDVDWSELYPEYAMGKRMSKRVEVVAVGDRSDDLLVAIAARLPSTLMTIFDFRRKSFEATQNRIAALRYENAIDVPIPNAVTYGNIAVVLANGLKEIPDFFTSYQLRKVFLCFPSKRQAKRMSRHGFRMSDAYAHVVQPGGLLYTICKMEDGTEYLHEKLNSDEAHPLWELVPEEEWRADECVAVIKEMWQDLSTAHIAVWRRTEVYS